MAQKRLLGNVDEPSDADLPDGKRPRISFASVIVEAMKMNKFCAALEPLLRKVVTEEVDKALARHVPVSLRSSTKRIQGFESRKLRLQFQNRLSLPLFTGGRVEGEQGCPIHMVLSDASSGEVIKSGPESSLKVEIIVLEGDFGPDEEEDWTMEDFDNHVVREREGKRPLLTGDLVTTLKDGIGTLGELTFTDNSSWIRSRKFRLGARVAGGANDGIRIREAMTEAFTVKDHRGELYKKHYPPVLHDEVWRLDKIGKDGAFHKRLNNEGIYTVQDFLRLVVMDPQRLRQILGTGMSNKMWEGTVDHARTCGLNNKHFVYYADPQHNIGLVFNTICEFTELITEGQSIPVDDLAEAQKPYVQKLVKHAYQHWDRVIEYDEGFQFGRASRIEVPDDSQGPPGSIFQMTDLPQERDAQGAQPGHKSQTMVSRFVNHNQSTEQVNSDWLHAGDSLNIATSNQAVIGTGFAQQNIVAQTSESSSLALGPRPVQMVSPALSFQTQNVNSHMHRRNSFRSEYEEKGIRDLYGERNIARDDWNREPHEGMEGLYRTKSNGELPFELENRGFDVEDFHVQMQNWIRIFNAGTGEQAYNFFPNTQMDHGFAFTGFPPASDGNFNMSQARLHDKASMGWLKLKAALKWGICVRKVAAAKRAKLEEIED